MNDQQVDRIVQALLYEGYLLYPYRRCVKTQQRWTFGGVYPRAYSEAHGGSDPWNMQTQCLIRAGNRAALEIQIRFLQLQCRTGGPSADDWQEAVERKVRLGPIPLEDLIGRPRCRAFSFPHDRRSDPSPDGAAPIVREQEAIAGRIELSAEPRAAGLFAVTGRIFNHTPFDPADSCGGPQRDAAVLRSFISTHMVLTAPHGQFISLTDPPPDLRDLAGQCRNIGCWPVLIGEAPEADTLLASPIILYDYPQVAPQSPGDLFDATEIDEILTLRIMTLTDEEKKEAGAIDARASDLLARTEALAREQLMNLHGTMHLLHPTPFAEQPHD